MTNSESVERANREREQERRIAEACVRATSMPSVGATAVAMARATNWIR